MPASVSAPRKYPPGTGTQYPAGDRVAASGSMEGGLKDKALAFEYVNLDEIVEREGNPKDHDLGAIIESFRRFGFVAPVQLEGESTRLLAGHGRVRALKAMRDSGEPPPARVL